MAIVEKIYKISDNFPKSETYGLASQIRRAAISVSLNIAEGSGADSDAEFSRFLIIAKRSAYEVICCMEIACKLNYCSKNNLDSISAECDEICAMIYSLTKKLKFDSCKLKAASWRQ